jgi:hypothetical protein
MDQQKKLYAALGVLVLLAALVFVQRKSEHTEAQNHSLEGQAASLPKLGLSDEVIKGIDRFVIVKPAESDAGVPTEVELVKTGDEAWDLKKPITAKANASNVKSLLDNLSKLSLSELITSDKSEYPRWGVSDRKGLHATFFKGKDAVFDAYFGENGSRGQMTRIAGHDGVFAVKGYSKWLYDRDAKGWRDKSMLKFDEKDVVKVEVKNSNGLFTFEKSGESWTGKHGKSAGSQKPIEKFQSSKVDDLLRAYKSLSAMDFGDDKKPADVGLDDPAAVVTIELKGGKATYVLKVGGNAESSNRWAMTNESDQIYAISSWSADWATANVSKFQVSESKPAAPTAQAHGTDESEQ